SERYKGHREVIEAWPSVLRAIPNARLRIVGKGDDVDDLRRRAAGLPIEFLGPIDDAALIDEYATADVFALPSWGEGYGIVYVEAGAAGLPSIAHRPGPAEEIVVPETGWLVDGRAPARIADALIEALGDREKTRRMGLAARERVLSQFAR